MKIKIYKHGGRTIEVDDAAGKGSIGLTLLDGVLTLIIDGVKLNVPDYEKLETSS